MPQPKFMICPVDQVESFDTAAEAKAHVMTLLADPNVPVKAFVVYEVKEIGTAERVAPIWTEASLLPSPVREFQPSKNAFENQR